eukprot:gb/GFBE01082923.1/.p1 GENE.gb/GFBE01082923.1/~~gb/GFBE01082923.1/.p1  ORF type:complete len:267 (+),score=46.84 gb/GFBE01082923.1/:1-801(+)
MAAQLWQRCRPLAQQACCQGVRFAASPAAQCSASLARCFEPAAALRGLQGSSSSSAARVCRRSVTSEASSGAYVCSACGSSAPAFSFLCRSCGKLMEASYGTASHYDLLGLDTSFEVEAEAVDSAYKELQRSLHPDRHAQASEEQRLLAETHSARLNEAVAVLRSPLLRARYWMELHGARILEEDQRIEDTATMMEVMETSEEMEDAETRSQIDEISERNSAKIRVVESELAGIFSKEDWAGARRLVERLQMLTRLQQRLDDWQPS